MRLTTADVSMMGLQSSVMFFSVKGAVGFGMLLMRAVEMGAYCFTVAGLLVLFLL